jgi:hypothetical protein
MKHAVAVERISVASKGREPGIGPVAVVGAIQVGGYGAGDHGDRRLVQLGLGGSEDTVEEWTAGGIEIGGHPFLLVKL